MKMYVFTMFRCVRTKCPHYDAKLHLTQLCECLVRWRAAVKPFVDMNDTEVVSVELMCVDIICEMDDTTTCLVRLLESRHIFYKADKLLLFQMTFTLIESYLSHNFIRFFRILDNCQSRGYILLTHAAAQYVCVMRRRAIESISLAYRGKGITLPLSLLMKWLRFDNIDDVRACLSLCNCKIDADTQAINFSEHQIDLKGRTDEFVWSKCDNLFL
jgi:hypothetical protein